MKCSLPSGTRWRKPQSGPSRARFAFAAHEGAISKTAQIQRADRPALRETLRFPHAIPTFQAIGIWIRFSRSS